MVKKIKVLLLVNLSILFVGCFYSGKPSLESIRFKTDCIIEYIFAITPEADAYYPQSCSVTLPDGTKMSYDIIDYTTITLCKGTIYLTEDIPDGSSIKIVFENAEKEYLLTHTFIK